MSSIERIIPPRTVKLVGTNYVARLLPFRERRMVGPFIFLDHMPLHEIVPGDEQIRNGTLDVPPHPHIGLSTLTYLFDGRTTHRDSMGYVQDIQAGDVNWMTAGRGTAHSERVPDDIKNPNGNSSPLHVHGLQAWVALPKETEESAPSFQHHDRSAIPAFERDGAKITLVAGDALGERSPVLVSSPLFYLHAKLPANKVFQWETRKNDDAAIYLMTGAVEVDGQIFDQPNMIVFNRNSPIRVRALQDATFMLLGGEPLEGERHIYWNFVASSKDRIEEAKREWREQRFAKIPGETEFMPLPER